MIESVQSMLKNSGHLNRNQGNFQSNDYFEKSYKIQRKASLSPMKRSNKRTKVNSIISRPPPREDYPWAHCKGVSSQSPANLEITRKNDVQIKCAHTLWATPSAMIVGGSQELLELDDVSVGTQ